MIRRPNPLRWLVYAVGGSLPAENREWVLFDLTTRTWVLRHFARTTVQLAPILVALYLLLPLSPWLALGAAIGGATMGFIYSCAYMHEAAEHRAVKAGYPRGTAANLRAAASAEESEEASRRYSDLWRSPDDQA